MKTFLKVSLLLGLMVFVLLALPALTSHLLGGFLGGLAALAVLVVGGVLILGLLAVGGGTALVVALALLLALACGVAAIALPIVLPVLLVVGMIALIAKLARRRTTPAPVATVA